jgi:transcriptional regulator with XRE-family HTH domain
MSKTKDEEYYRKLDRLPDYSPSDIEFIRQKRDLTQKQLAEKLSVSDVTVRNWESGRVGIGVENTKILQETFGELEDLDPVSDESVSSDFDREPIYNGVLGEPENFVSEESGASLFQKIKSKLFGAAYNIAGDNPLKQYAGESEILNVLPENCSKCGCTALSRYGTYSGDFEKLWCDNCKERREIGHLQQELREANRMHLSGMSDTWKGWGSYDDYPTNSDRDYDYHHCVLCDRDVRRSQRHHVSYTPERIIEICVKCHFAVHFIPSYYEGYNPKDSGTVNTK